jgi:tetratricopeptide (TPR) repeat protein
MSSDPTSDHMIQRGIQALELAEFEDAIELFEQAAVEDSSDPNAWFYLGLCYLETGRSELAIEALGRAITADSNYADAHYLLGTAYGAVGKIDRAAESYRSALAIQSDHPKADEFLMRTEALIASREHYRSALRLIYSPTSDQQAINQAIRELLHSVAIFNASPAASEFQRLAGRIVQSGQYTGMAIAGAEGPFWATALRNAEQAFDRRAWPEAAASYHQALDLSWEHAFIHHALGLIYFTLGDGEGGIRAWQQTLDLDPNYDFSAIGRVASREL